MTHTKQHKVGVLGATGTVGQRFIALLAEHPFFVVDALGASSRSAGKPYCKAVNWKQTRPIPGAVRDMVVHECDPAHFKDCAIVFSGLDADVAGEIGACARRSHPPPALPIRRRKWRRTLSTRWPTATTHSSARPKPESQPERYTLSEVPSMPAIARSAAGAKT